MSFKHVRSTYHPGDSEQPADPGNNLHTEDEFRAADLEILCRQLFLALQEHPPPKNCACFMTLKQAELTLKRLGIHI